MEAGQGAGGEADPGGDVRAEDLVLVVHGTWNEPEPGKTKWYQAPSSEEPANFTTRLNDALEARGVGREVWRELDGVRPKFSWSGKNTHEARVEGSEGLVETLRTFWKARPHARVRIVAHSHGGNVVLSALRTIFDEEDDHAAALENRLWAEARTAVRDGATAARAAAAVSFGDFVVPVRARSESAVRTALARALEAYGEYKRAKRGKVHRFPGHTRWVPNQAAPVDLAKRNYWGRRHEFERALQQALTSRVGSVVFLGTPFYEKTWPHARRGAARIQRGFFSVLGALPLLLVGGPIAAYAVLLGCSAIAVLVSWEYVEPTAAWLGFDPTAWPGWVLIVGVVVWLVFGFAVLAESLAEDVRLDGSLYAIGRRRRRRSAARIPALVVHATRLDEALLGLSVVPLSRAFVLPQLKAELKPVALLRPGKLGSGVDHRASGVVARGVVLQGILFLASALLLPWWPIRRFVIAPILTRYVGGKLMGILTMTAYGLPADELRQSVVRAREQLHANADYETRSYDVTRELISAPPQTRPDQGGSAKRYEFLWNDEQLDAQLVHSKTWEKIAPQTDDVLRSQGLAATEDHVRDLQRTCAMVDTRLKELGGAIELMHSSYYSNDEILDLIADFLVDPASVETDEPGDDGRG